MASGIITIQANQITPPTMLPVVRYSVFFRAARQKDLTWFSSPFMFYWQNTIFFLPARQFMIVFTSCFLDKQFSLAIPCHVIYSSLTLIFPLFH
jgi:hypothetical protein